MTSCTRKRRIDEDYALAVVARAQTGNSRGRGVLHRARGSVASTTYSWWGAEAALQYATPGHLVFAGVDEFSFTHAGARLGALVEATMMVCLERVAAGVARVWPSQAPPHAHARRVARVP